MGGGGEDIGRGGVPATASSLIWDINVPKKGILCSESTPESRVGEEFLLVEDTLQREFLPEWFHGVETHMLGQEVIQLPVKQAGLIFLNPTLSTPDNCTVSYFVTGYLVTTL